MKRAFKIIGITIGSLVGVVLLLVATVLWVVFTPERLTPIVRNIASEYVLCDHKIEKVELTFFSTFPKFGLEIDSILLVNTMEDAPNDTLFAIPKLTATVDVAELLNKDLHIYELSITDMQANAYMDASGASNLDVFRLPADTAAEDTTTTPLPLKSIRVDELCISANQLHLLSLRDSINANIAGVSVGAKVKSFQDVHLTLAIASADAIWKDVQYAKQMSLSVDIPAHLNYETIGVSLSQARLAVNQFELTLDGWVTTKDTIAMDLQLDLQDWRIGDAIALLPPNLLSTMDGITADGVVSLSAHAKGIYANNYLPIVDAHVILKEGKAKYAELPYTIQPLTLDANLHLDMQNKQQTIAHINNLFARTRNSSLALKGMVKDPMGKMWMNVQTNMNVQVPDVKEFLPKDMQAKGQIKGRLTAQMYLEDLLAMQLENGKISGDLQLNGIHYEADNAYAALPNNRLLFQIPNAHPSRTEVNWLSGSLDIANGEVVLPTVAQAEVGETSIAVELSNPLADTEWLYANLSLDSKEQIHAAMDSMDILLKKPVIDVYATYNMEDTTTMPSVDAQLSFEQLSGYYADIQLDVAQSALAAELHAPSLKASIQSQSLYAKMGTQLEVKTQKIGIQASARHSTRGGDNLLLKWRPKLSVDLNQAEVAIADLEEKVIIPEIDFSYSNKDFHIEKSKIILGKSDFELTGDVTNIGRWLRKKGDLTGELNFVSNHTDANELLSLLSAKQGSEETAKVETETKTEKTTDTNEAEPFLVPTHVDLTLNTKIKKAQFMDQTATNLGGKIYIKDGILVLEEVGFICNAAKLQLTAMYRTPRRNHIYVGFDYHMMDINIHELIGMIPEIDSMMPMLKQFKGNAEFHLAAETFTNAQYKIKPSTLRGAASIFGKDLVVLDNTTFDKISKLLMFKKKTENKVDSISAEMTLYKKEIDVYPFSVSMDNYTVALGGRHNLDMTFDYNINVLSPIYLGVNVSGNLDDLKIKLARCKYAKDFKPMFHKKVDSQSAELRSIIRESMRKNVKL
jgi:hypothetical protein